MILSLHRHLALTGEQLVGVDCTDSEIFSPAVEQNLYLPIFNNQIRDTRKLISVVRDQSRSIGEGN